MNMTVKAKTHKPASLRRFLLTGILSVVFLAGLTTAFFNYRAVSEQVEELFDAEMAQMARVLQSLLKSSELTESSLTQTLNYEDFVNSPFDTFTDEEKSSAVEYSEYGHKYEKKLAFQVWDQSGNLILQTRTAKKSGIPLQSPGFNTLSSFSKQSQSDSLWHTFTLQDSAADTIIQVAQTDDVRSELTIRIAAQQILAPLLITPVVAVLIWYLIGYAFRPLQKISDQVSSLNINNLQPVGGLDIPAEIQVLVNSLNQLFYRVKKQAIRERRFTADVAHELRTPLAALKIQLQNGLRRLIDDPARKSLQKAELALENMINLVELLLLLNKLETTYTIADTVPIRVADLIPEIVSLLEEKAIKARVNITTEIKEHVVVNAHRSLLLALISNLLDNALKYSPEGKSIDILLANGQLKICDVGPGIPATKLENVFQRFYRVEGDGATGSGLGLSICRQIAKLYGFSVKLENRTDVITGLAASIDFAQGKTP